MDKLILEWIRNVDEMYGMYVEYTEDLARQNNFEKKKGGGLRLPDFGVYSKAQESCGAGTKPVTDQWNRRKTDNNLDTHSVDF